MGVLLACGSRVTFICAFLFLQNSMLTSSEDVNENQAIYQSTGEEDDVAYQNIFQHQDGPGTLQHLLILISMIEF